MKQAIKESKPVVSNIEHVSRGATDLVIWTDCDREGEAIGFDIIDVCRRVNPRLDIYRAHFSALTLADLERAALNLERPN